VLKLGSGVGDVDAAVFVQDHTQPVLLVHPPTETKADVSQTVLLPLQNVDTAELDPLLEVVGTQLLGYSRSI